MRVPAGLEVGVCSHTGLVRGANEDDYLLATPIGTGEPGFVAAVADGMGGVAGGAEASRSALRGLGTILLDGSAGGAPRQRIRDGFRAANARIYEAATAVPALRDMGTTMTAIWLGDGRVAFGHIGDSRLYRVRDDRCEPLTTDHSVREGESLLTRCLGGGQVDSQPDDGDEEVLPGDRFVLCTDGVWNVVAPDTFAEVAAGAEPQVVAERLVQRALDGGGPDNATVVVVDVLSPTLSASTPDVEVDLPRAERPDARALWPAARSLRPSPLVWLVLVAALALLAWATLRWAGVDARNWLGPV